uniref:STEEP1 domain-containing protein n=1 Tax=Chlamydomonas leiostraca TaxID=1034604 RepID=A0A7S0RN43_9CHLO|mmetsp:Transcript_26771/g.68189  ORF Transcript_26771/g.68189 Transcript_26771/m.68189 type:complete len:247 (+) Transcript_26771:28-768(+)
MPKRTTLTFTSEDAPATGEERLFVYYCKYTGKHAFTIDSDIEKLPRRRTDGARIIDTEEHTVKLYTTDGGVKLIKRHNGNIERQYRLNVGTLPVAYRCEKEGQFIYVLSDSVTTYVNQAVIMGTKVLVPPCIRPHKASGGTEVRLEIEDRVHRPALVKITADHVRIHITSNVAVPEAVQTEVLQMMAKALGARLTQLQLHRGTRGRQKFLVIEHLQPQEVFEKLQAAVGRITTQTEQENRTLGSGR